MKMVKLGKLNYLSEFGASSHDSTDSPDKQVFNLICNFFKHIWQIVFGIKKAEREQKRERLRDIREAQEEEIRWRMKNGGGVIFYLFPLLPWGVIMQKHDLPWD